MRFFPDKTRRNKVLALRKTPGNVIELLSQCFFRGLLILPLAIIFIELAGETAFIPLAIIFATVFLVGFFDLLRSLKLVEIPFSEQDLFRSTTKKYLMHHGWQVKNNNTKYFHASKMQGQIGHYFYLVYENEKAYACFLYDYPFPFSMISARREIKILRGD